MNTAGKIEVTGVDLKALLRAAYRLSSPQGMGFIHAREGELDDASVDEIMSRGTQWAAFSTDYVHGRSMKFSVRRHGDRLFIDRQWYDHSPAQLADLLTAVGLPTSLIDRAHAEWNAYLEAEVALVLAHMREQGGSFVEKYLSDTAGFFEEHATGFHEAQTRGLLTTTPGNRETLWKLTEKAEA